MAQLDVSVDVNNENVKYHLSVNDTKSVDNAECNIMYLNCQSMKNKLFDIEMLVASFKCKTDILVFTEIWLREDLNKFFNIPGYDSYYSNRNDGYGGTAIFVKSYISSTKIYSIDNDYCQILIVKLIKKNVNLISFYRSQKNSMRTFSNTFEFILSTYPRSIVVGDFNINLLDKECVSVLNYQELINSLGFNILNKIHPDYATRKRNGINTIIDHIISDIFTFQYDFSISATNLSDHELLYLRVANLSIPKLPAKRKCTVLDYSRVLTDSAWANILTAKDMEDVVDNMSGIVNRCTKTVYKPNYANRINKEWMSTEILALIKERDKFFKLKNKSPQNVYVANRYANLSSVITTKVKKAKMQYNRSYVDSCIEKPKDLWMHLKKIIFNKSVTNQQNFFIKSGHVLETNPLEIAKIFNVYFANVAHSLTSNFHRPALNDFDFIIYQIHSPFELTYTDENEVYKIIMNLKSDSATGFDKISSKILKYCAYYISSVIAKVFNKCVDESKFPDCLKVAKVIPVFKAGSPTDVTNFRPVSVLSNFSKVIESLLLVRLEKFLDKNNIISKTQFGFTKKSGTSSACLNLTNFLSIQFDKKKFCACLFLDIRRAFDTVDHEILLIKLSKLGLTMSDLKLFKNYLENRFQMVSINENLSDTAYLGKGVPQGSILGPCFFRIFINDMALVNLHGTLQLYADDGAIMYTANSIDMIYSMIQHDLDVLKLWFDKNHLILNHEKTKYMIFENRLLDVNILNTAQITYDSFLIERVNKYKYLGLTIDSRLNWVAHIDSIKKSILPYIFAIGRTRYLLPKSSLLLLYNAYVQSHLVYLNPIWSGCAKYKAEELLILQKRVLKYIINVPTLYPSQLLFRQFKSLNFLSQRELLILIYKIVKGIIKHNFDLIQINETHNYDTRRRSHFYVDFFATSASNNNVLHRGIQIFNNLPPEIKHAYSYSMFKSKITAYLEN